MKPLAGAADYGLRFAACGSHRAGRLPGDPPCRRPHPPATLFLSPDRVRIVAAGGRFEATHPRFPLFGKTSYLPGQRAEQLAAVAGTRKRLYFMRERLLELGPVGEGYLTELIHARPHTWKGDVERLFALLEEVGEERFTRCLSPNSWDTQREAVRVCSRRNSAGDFIPSAECGATSL